MPYTTWALFTFKRTVTKCGSCWRKSDPGSHKEML